jgi:hypothetical protein
MTKRSNAYLLNTIKRILTHGIYLGANTNPDRYLEDLCYFFNQRGLCYATLDNDELIIEDRGWTPMLSLKIEKNTLIFTPLEDAVFFQSFLDTLEFVTNVWTAKKYDKKEETKKEDSPKKDDDSDDFEWI